MIVAHVKTSCWTVACVNSLDFMMHTAIPFYFAFSRVIFCRLFCTAHVTRCQCFLLLLCFFSNTSVCHPVRMDCCVLKWTLWFKRTSLWYVAQLLYYLISLQLQYLLWYNYNIGARKLFFFLKLAVTDTMESNNYCEKVCDRSLVVKCCWGHLFIRQTLKPPWSFERENKTEIQLSASKAWPAWKWTWQQSINPSG